MYLTVTGKMVPYFMNIRKKTLPYKESNLEAFSLVLPVMVKVLV